MLVPLVVLACADPSWRGMASAFAGLLALAFLLLTGALLGHRT